MTAKCYILLYIFANIDLWSLGETIEINFAVLLSYVAVKDELPKSAWLVSKMGRVTAGVQFEPQSKNYTYFIPLEIFLYVLIFSN